VEKVMNFKQLAASYALEFVTDGMLLGLGTGSTTACFIDQLGEKISRGFLRDVTGVPTSEATAHRASQLGIPITSLSRLIKGPELPTLDLAVDGADEVDPHLDLIKGLGRAMLREKIVESRAKRFIVIVDESKVVPRLGRGPLPVEILPFEADLHIHWLNSLGCRAELWRETDGTPALTDNGNYLARCWFPDGIQDAESLVRLLAHHPGIVENGLFLNMANTVIIAGEEGITQKERE
jgi:ribose 5-phosphate isomerase A